MGCSCRDGRATRLVVARASLHTAVTYRSLHTVDGRATRLVVARASLHTAVTYRYIPLHTVDARHTPRRAVGWWWTAKAAPGHRATPPRARASRRRGRGRRPTYLLSDSISGMEWNGMEWNGMEWNGMEWNGMEWNGMEWWFGSKPPRGMEWNGMQWIMECDGMRCDAMRCDATRRDGIMECHLIEGVTEETVTFTLNGTRDGGRPTSPPLGGVPRSAAAAFRRVSVCVCPAETWVFVFFVLDVPAPRDARRY